MARHPWRPHGKRQKCYAFLIDMDIDMDAQSRHGRRLTANDKNAMHF
jgi:hypothetical protein